MTASARNPTRSIHGCWTCRVRRKKCDETRPSCSVCISLELECHGYGPRPEWMDNGILQRDQALKIKCIVSQTKYKKGNRQQPSATRSLQDLSSGQGLLSTENLSSPAPPSSISTCQQLNKWNGTIDQDWSHFQLDEADLSSFIDPAWSTSSHNDILTTGSLFDLDIYTAISRSSTNKESEQDSSSSESSKGLLLFGSDSPIIHEASMLDQDTEDALFMNYLDQVFYFQYPFYHSLSRHGRGWLFSILRRSKPAYHATLALSECHLLSTVPLSGDIPTSLVHTHANYGNYDLAFQEMRLMMEGCSTWNESTRLVHSLECLTSILQLLFCELLAGGSKNWQELLWAAASFVPSLLQERMSLTLPELASPHYPSKQLYKRILYAEHDSATSVLLASFISFDIIASASTRSSPFLNVDHIQALNNLDISLESLIGCRNSVMALIFEISSLDRWKKEAQAAHKLSIVDLAKRGSQIEERLRHELADIEKIRSTEPSLWSPPGMLSVPSHSEISQLFALSAIIYLHVVISGAYPDLPEIAEAVSKAIVVFKSLKDPRLLRSVVWPFCVSGCLALEEQQSFFRDLVSGAGITQWTSGTCFEAFKIMQKCWKARKTCSYSCDWTTGYSFASETYCRLKYPQHTTSDGMTRSCNNSFHTFSHFCRSLWLSIDQMISSRHPTIPLKGFNAIVAQYASEMSPGWIPPPHPFLDSYAEAGTDKTLTLLFQKIAIVIAAGEFNPLFWEAAMGIAAFNIIGSTLHSLFALVKTKRMDPPPGTPQNLQAFFSNFSVHYY
ncbi:C6 transcription factor [Xylogone sp. PMI_703]|nr:C6 transcription factor [Xylogone sp. PMI_703]